MATLTQVAALIDDLDNTAFTPEPFLDELTDSFVYYAKDVRTYASRLNSRFTLFLDSNDNSLVGFEIKGFLRLVNFMRQFDVFVTNSTVRLDYYVAMAIRPEDFDSDTSNQGGTIESITMFLREEKFNKRAIDTKSLTLCEAM